MYKVKGREVKKRWIVLLFALAAISVLGLVVSPSEGLFEMTNESLWANMAWMITATIFVLMMTPGLSFFYGGMARAKNVISTMLQSFIVMGVVSVIWVVFGFGLAKASAWRWKRLMRSDSPPLPSRWRFSRCFR